MRPQTAKATRGRVIFLDIQPQAALSKSCGSASGFTLVWFCCESNHSAIIVLLLPLPNPVRTHFTYITIYSGYVFIFSCEISLVKCSLLARWISFSFVRDGAGARGAPPLMRVEVTYVYIILSFFAKARYFIIAFAKTVAST